eukprot:s6390_g1.t1
MTSDGGGMDRRLCLDGSVEDYEEYLQRLHTGLVYVIQEEVNRALLSEYESLTKATQAIEPINLAELNGNTSVEFAPGKLDESQMDSKSNFLNAGKTADIYAAGIDGTSIRTALRSAGAKGWTAA